MNKVYFMLLISMVLTSCASTQIPISVQTISSDVEAAKIIERVFLEQPIKFRPDDIVVTKEYVALAEGMRSQSRGSATVLPVGNMIVGIGKNKTFIRNTSTRIYFDSIRDVQLYKKRDWFIIQILDSGGRVIKNVYCREKILSNQFVASFNYLSN